MGLLFRGVPPDSEGGELTQNRASSAPGQSGALRCAVGNAGRGALGQYRVGWLTLPWRSHARRGAGFGRGVLGA